MNTPQTPARLIIGPSAVKLLSTLGIGMLGMAIGAAMLIISFFGMTTLRSTGWIIIAVIVALGIVNLVIALMRQRPRLEIDAEGFSMLPLFGGHSRRWSDIDGDFAVIKNGFGQAVAYRLTPEYKASIGFKPTTLYEGNDCAIAGAFATPIPELAEVLNEWKARGGWVRTK